MTVKDNNFMYTLGIGLLLQAGTAIWWLANLSNSVSHNDFQIRMISKEVAHNSKFVQDWPAGKWGSGSLPDDVKQNLNIDRLQQQVEKLEKRVYNGAAPH